MSKKNVDLSGERYTVGNLGGGGGLMNDTVALCSLDSWDISLAAQVKQGTRSSPSPLPHHPPHNYSNLLSRSDIVSP